MTGITFICVLVYMAATFALNGLEQYTAAFTTAFIALLLLLWWIRDAVNARRKVKRP